MDDTTEIKLYFLKNMTLINYSITFGDVYMEKIIQAVGVYFQTIELYQFFNLLPLLVKGEENSFKYVG